VSIRMEKAWAELAKLEQQFKNPKNSFDEKLLLVGDLLAHIQQLRTHLTQAQSVQVETLAADGSRTPFV